MRICRPIVFAALALAFPGAWAQAYKCLDAAGKVTYSGTACDLLGLRNAGEVPERLQVSPAQKVAPQAPKPTPAAPAAAAQSGAADAKDAKKEPERRCFKTAKGTRCNDKPEEE
jgi:hypothetical protein